MPSPDNNHTNHERQQQKQMQEILTLLTARTAGQATNEQVEAAVGKMLGPVQVDTDNYDDDDDDVKQTATPREEDSSKRAATKSSPTKQKQTPALYQDIPLGQQGARMLTTFGDGVPLPETVQATLQGTRRMLHVAIQDARHVRRQRRESYTQAQATLTVHRKKLPAGPSFQTFGAETLYRAHTGYDRLAYQVKCGFDVEELQQLYPEEMNAYFRWNASYEAYSAKTGEKQPVVDDDDDNTSNNNNNNNKADDDNHDNNNTDDLAVSQEDDLVGGHLSARAAQFDIRTDQMKDDRYLEFSELRKGSFLPRRGSAMDDDAKMTKWANMAPAAIRFLHWVGFDPDSALPPPDASTTHALAFLAYDFFGRIVEKAIELRVSKRNDLVLELQPGERLEPHDIQRAMEDPDIRPVPLYSSSSSDAKAGPQLYFGPGFEHRLEMELEEIMSGRDCKDEESLKLQKQEEELFARLAQEKNEDEKSGTLMGEETNAQKETDPKPKRKKRKKSSS